MINKATRLFSPRLISLLIALFAGAGALLPTDHGQIDHAVAAPGPKTAALVQGIHVQRTGDMPEARERAKIVVNAQQAQCGSALMKQACQTTLSDPAASSRAKSRCVEMMSSYNLSGNLNSVGETVTDEYFAPPMNRSASVVKTTVLRQTGVCSAEVEQKEQHVIVHHRPDGYTRYERKTDKSGQQSWLMHEHRYVPGLADMLKTSFDAARLSGKATVTEPLGHKTLAPGRTCETRRIGAGAVEFVSCIHATGLKFPSHVTFESEVVASGKAERVEKFVSYAHNVAISRDLFFPKQGEKAMTEKDIRSDPNNPTNKWCATEKARTGVDPCKDDDE
ncbi:MAG: hypothetical protein Q8N54_01325 [Sulfurimicrobium sp.]|nr:hypothetical protein [Sulfurimicrobium sp.]